MMFSKSFGYALRSILYIAKLSDDKKRVQIEEVASAINVPRHFLGKIMKKLASEGILDSVKGPYGGFSLNEKTLSTSVMDIIRITDGLSQFNNCVIRLQKCNPEKPCPLHHRVEKTRAELAGVFNDTTIDAIMKSESDDFISGITTQV
jgi:Rrf2 family protein